MKLKTRKIKVLFSTIFPQLKLDVVSVRSM